MDNQYQQHNQLLQKRSRFANRIILTGSNNSRTIYLPVYLRFLLKDIKSVEFENLNAQLTITLAIAIYIDKLPQNIVQYIKTNIIMNLSRDGSLKLDMSDPSRTVNLSTEKQYLHFTVRKIVSAKMEPYVFLTPYQLIDLNFTTEFRTMNVYHDKQNRNDQDITRLQIKFNLMDNVQKQKKYNFVEGCSYGSYALAQKRIHIEYDAKGSHKTLMQLNKNIYNIKCLDQRKQQVTQQQDEQNSKQKYFQYAHIHIPVYRRPYVVLGTVFIPLWLLGIVNLAIFYQEPGLGDRISNIANLMTVFIAIIPTLRDKLPPHPYSTLIQFLIYMQIFTELLCLINSLRIRQVDEDTYQYDAYSNPQYLISLVITIVVIALPIISLIYHQIVVVPQHHQESFKSLKSKGMDYRKQWCDPEDIKIWKDFIKKKELIDEQSKYFKQEIKRISQSYDKYLTKQQERQVQKKKQIYRSKQRRQKKQKESLQKVKSKIIVNQTLPKNYKYKNQLT